MKQNDKKIVCEFDYCVYNKEKECTLICVNISPTGICSDCIVPNIDKSTLEKYKQATLAKLLRL